MPSCSLRRLHITFCVPQNILYYRMLGRHYVDMFHLTSSDTYLFLDEFFCYLCQFNKTLVLDVNMNITYNK